MASKSPTTASVPRFFYDIQDILATGLYGSRAAIYRDAAAGGIALVRCNGRTGATAEEIERKRRSLQPARLGGAEHMFGRDVAAPPAGTRRAVA
jgi:hypothetical protein